MPAAAQAKSKPIKANPGRSRGRPKLEDVAEIESRLLAVALKQFVQYGYGGASMRRIVIAAKMSKTTLYSRFASKEELFRAIMVQQNDRLAVSFLRSEDGLPSLEDGLKAYANRTLEYSLKGDLLNVNRLVYSESHRFPELGAAAAERSMVGVQQVADFIRERAAADRIPCKNPDAVAEVFIMTLRGWYVNNMLTNRKIPAAMREQWVERAVHTLVSARKDW